MLALNKDSTNEKTRGGKAWAVGVPWRELVGLQMSLEG